ncbi:Periostin [Neolecta irregularis DAH-3]|uniref:Periostin n=1 Tax=Neolecta irregularis (strain DAH-3) TaxID=1198029 RepID=A0A1U7LQI5_NEOID|nr:Periostin [Neolecta irregularis DAH-3]|eukprot:OLL24925.1 Periostin [Neolecta irregularis DAH-3]
MKTYILATVFPAVLGYAIPPGNFRRDFIIQKNPEFLVDSDSSAGGNLRDHKGYDSPVYHILGESDRTFNYKPDSGENSVGVLSGLKQAGPAQRSADAGISPQWHSPPPAENSFVGAEHFHTPNFPYQREPNDQRPGQNSGIVIPPKAGRLKEKPENDQFPHLHPEPSSLFPVRADLPHEHGPQRPFQGHRMEHLPVSDGQDALLLFPPPLPASELDWPVPPQVDKDCHDQNDKTLLEVLEASPLYTILKRRSAKLSSHRKLYALIKDDQDLSDELSKNDATLTLFAPTDEAIDHLKEHHFSDERLRTLLPYHISPEVYDSHRLFASRVLPTTLKSQDLVQHMRVSSDLHGLKLNFYSRVVFKDVHCKNGILHSVNSVVFAPPEIKEVLNLFAEHSSTFLYAIYKTGLIDELKGTVFVPSNYAFSRLPPKVRFFLFSKWGENCLKKILQFHIAPNNVVYTDVLVDAESERKHYSINVPTLLADRSLSIDIFKFRHFTNVKVNGESLVTTTDIVAKNGVVHNTWKIILPPKRLSDGGEEEYGLTVQGLIEALDEKDDVSGWEDDYYSYSSM